MPAHISNAFLVTRSVSAKPDETVFAIPKIQGAESCSCRVALCMQAEIVHAQSGHLQETRVIDFGRDL